jgi:hypothetical protein
MELIFAAENREKHSAALRAATEKTSREGHEEHEDFEEGAT